MPTKDEEAIKLANKHYQIDGGLTCVIQINSNVTVVQPDERIILLEVNSSTVPAGIMPLHFSPVPSAGIHYPSVIMEVTPDEYEQIQKVGPISDPAALSIVWRAALEVHVASKSMRPFISLSYSREHDRLNGGASVL
jgi:hypothetical protein